MPDLPVKQHRKRTLMIDSGSLRRGSVTGRVVKWSLAAVVHGAVLLGATVAMAGEEALGSESSEQQSDYLHNGFYFRLSLGRGGQWGALGDYRYLTSGLSVDILLGGMPRPGLGLGLGLFGATSASTTVKLHGDVVATEKPLGIVLAGPFVDGFPNPRSGLHYGSSMGVSTSGINELSRGRGFGYATWVGYGIWMDADYSAGVLLRGIVAHTFWGEESATGKDLHGSMGSLDLCITLLYN